MTDVTTLTDLIAERLGCDVDVDPDASPLCSQPYYCQTHGYDSTSEVCSLVKDTTAVVADWLDGLADAHNAKIALLAGVESSRDTSTAHGMRRAAAEARKGADQ